MDGARPTGWWRRRREESPKLHGPSFGTPDLEADGPEARGLALSVPPPPRGEGVSWFEGKERRALPLVPPTVFEDLTI